MLSLTHLSKQYNDQIIIDDLTITFPDTGLVSIVGKSGCGKSTLLQILANLDDDYSGTILFNNKPIDDQYKKESISYLMQDGDYINALTFKENILLPCVFSSLAVDKNEFNALISRFKVTHLLQRFPTTLSGGEKKRMSIIKALMKHSSILLCDEPTGPLDETNSIEVMKLLKEVSKERLVIVVTHDLKLAKMYSDSLLRFEHKTLSGQLHQSNHQPNIYQQYQKHFNNYSLRQLYASKNKLIVFMLFACITMTSSFLLYSSSNGLLKALDENLKYSVTSHVLRVEQNNKTLMDSINLTHTIEENSYSLELLNLSNDNQTLNAHPYFLPHSTSHIKLKWGNLPKNKNEVIVTESLYESLKSNDIHLQLDDYQNDLKVVGVVNKRLLQNDDIYLSLDLKEDLSSLENPYCKIIETATPLKHYKSLSKKYYVDNEAISQKISYKEIIKTFKLVGFVFMLVSIGMSIALIILIFQIIIESRIHDFAYLLTLGVTKTQLFIQTLIEANVLGVFVSTIGMVCCKGTYYYLNDVYQIINHLQFQLVEKQIFLSTYDFYLLLFTIYTTVVTLAAIIPTRKVLKSNLLESLREI